MQYRSICIAIFFATCCTWIQAASPSMPVRQEQLEQTRQEALIRSERRLAPQAVIGTAAVEHPSSTALPGGNFLLYPLHRGGTCGQGVFLFGT